jgi:xanthine dehydrogenase accessory factor
VRELLDEALFLLARGEPFALVTLVSRRGSAPRAAGARMLVRAGGEISGTVGGGLLEATAIRAAVESVAERQSRVIAVDLGGTSVDEARMLCGGDTQLLVAYVGAGDPELTAVLVGLAGAVRDGRRARLLTFFAAEGGPTRVEHCLLPDAGPAVGARPLAAAELRALAGEAFRHGDAELPDGRRVSVEEVVPPVTVLVFGAGHVGRALTPAAAAAGFRVVVLDDRPEFAVEEHLPAADRVVVLESFDRAFAGIEAGPRTYVVIVTRGHAHDFTVLRQALRGRAGYIGLMGSRSKRAKLFAALREEGFSEGDLGRVFTPIGLAIGAETPAELAVSITAELIKVRAETKP